MKHYVLMNLGEEFWKEDTSCVIKRDAMLLQKFTKFIPLDGQIIEHPGNREVLSPGEGYQVYPFRV